MDNNKEYDFEDTQGLNIGPWDLVLGTLTLPLLLFVLQYAITGSERMLKTRESRMRIYIILLIVEVIIGIILWKIFT